MSANGDDTLSELDSHNSDYVEQLLEDYLQDPERVPAVWQHYFRHLANGNGNTLVSQRRPSFQPSSVFDPPAPRVAPATDDTTALLRQHRTDQLVVGYRGHGHRAARLDPLGLAPRDSVSVDPAHYGLTPEDLDREIMTTFGGGDSRPMPLRDLISSLDAAYCGNIGYEYMHIPVRKMREWIQQRIERFDTERSPSRETQLRILKRLTGAVIFEEFVRKKWLGAHTFSLEGAETLIPLLDLALKAAAKDGLNEVVMAMAHRGRLNVLTNIIGKRPVDIFREFEDPYSDWYLGRGDVKYHLGASGDWTSPDGTGKLHVSLCFNPSHLEYVNPIAMGRVRAKQDRINDNDRRRGMALLIHGDAAFAGEGVVQESLNLSFLDSYTTGGTLHVILNNQLGFTTEPTDSRSSTYCSDVAKMLPVPIFHVNGEYPQEVARVVELAMEFRSTFQRDVVIDMYSFRRWGHNEADEPGFTQPLIYKAIENRPTTRDSYLKHLLRLGKVTEEEADEIADNARADLEKQFGEAKTAVASEELTPAGCWQPYFGGKEPDDGPDTGVAVEKLQSYIKQLVVVPEGFNLHKKLQRIMDRRQKMAALEEPVDWATAEALAFASLAAEGHPIRLSGQDCERGTFSQRHSVLHDTVDGHEYNIFSELSTPEAPIDIVNSPLCETGTLGFEYGYSLDYPEALVAWEAQYGDFVNAAQVIIDQFITSAEDKWRRLSGVVMLLPHAFEGKGPEHSSARLERFLFEAAEDNIQIVTPTTPAQYFHCLRRQVKRAWRKPLVVLTPKSLLRHPQVTSPMEEFTTGRFQRILSDERVGAPPASGVLLSSGKMYYDLVEAREKQNRHDIAILRVEQFYPLRHQVLAEALRPYPDETPVIWVQEEPENMGAWGYWKHRYCYRMLDRYPLSFVARTPSASPATGSNAAHYREHEELITRAFRLLL